MKQALEDLTQNLKCENENSEMDINGTVIKVELKSQFSQIQKPSARHESEIPNQDKSIVEIKYENKDQNEKSQYFENEEINSGKNPCQICKKSFTTKRTLKLHVKTVHDELKEYQCNICGKTFGNKSKLQFHIKRVHYSIKPHKCVSCYKSFGLI